nr:T9SS type A sorting domain-containing protein [Pseudarcicella sp.]
NEGIDNIRIFQAHGTALSSDNSPENYSGTTEELTPTSIVWNAAAARWEITIRVTGFSGFFVMTPQAGSLPLTLASFKGYANAQSNELTWATVSEQNFSHFEIQRTEDGKNWETIEKMEAINITTSVKNYSYNDKNPLLGNTYYRLKMIDINGSVSLSKAINIDNALIYGIKLFPNPTKEKLKINFASSVGEKIEVMLLDAKGKVISIENFKTQSKDFAHEINLKSLNVGIYFMKISDRKRQITQKIVKQ